MPNRYEIKIVTTSDPSGAQQTSKELDNVTKAAKPAADAIKGTGEEAEKAATKKSKLVDAVKKLHTALPELGLVISALKNPFTILAFGIGAVVSEFQKFKNEVDEAARALQVFDSANLSIRNFFEIIAKHNADSKAFAVSLNDIANKAQTANEKLASMNALIERTFGARRQIGQLEKEAELNQVAEDEATGRIKPAQAIARRTSIELKYAGANRRANEKEQQARLEALQKAQVAAINEQQQIVGELGPAERDSIAADQQQKRRQSLTTASLDDIARRAKNLNDIIARGRPEPLFPGSRIYMPGDQFDVEKFDKAKAGLRDLAKEKSQVQSLQVDADERANAARDRLNKLRGRSLAAEENIRGLGANVAEQRQVIAETSLQNQRIGPIEERTLRSGAAAQMAAEQKRLNEELSRQLVELTKSTAGFGLTITQLIQLLRRIGASQEEINRAVADLKAREAKNTLKP